MKKRIISLVVVFCLVLGLSSGLVLADDTTVEVTEITELGAGYEVHIYDEDERVYFSYTPEESGYYILTASGYYSYAYIYFYDENWNCLEEKYPGVGLDTRLIYELDKGTTYYIELGPETAGGTANVTFSISSADLVDITDTASYSTSYSSDGDIVLAYTPAETGVYSISIVAEADVEEGELSNHVDLYSFDDAGYAYLYMDDLSVSLSGNETDAADTCSNALMYAGKTYLFIYSLSGSNVASSSLTFTVENTGADDISETGTYETIFEGIGTLGGIDDFYLIYTPTETGVYAISLDGSVSGDYDGVFIETASVIDASYSNVGFTYASGYYSYPSVLVEGETYFIKVAVYGFGAADSSAPVDVEVTLSIAMLETEDISDTGTYTQTADDDGGSDIVSYTPARSGTYELTLAVQQEGTYAVATLYNSLGESLTEIYTETETKASDSVELTAGETYYIEVTNADCTVSIVFTGDEHDWYAVEEYDATCTEDGYIVYACTDCDETYVEVIPAAHSLEVSASVSTGSYYSTKDIYICSVCGEEKTVTSLYGSDRYETASDIVESTFDSCTYAVIANGSNFPDALAAASLAGALDAPILITSDSRIQDTIDDLENLGVTNVYIVGGTSSVSTDAESAIEAEGIEVERIAGGTRQTTAAAVAEEVLSITGTHDVCLVATGKTYADALAASPYAYWSESPIYLTKTDGSISDEVLASIEAAGYSQIIIIGGTSSVTEATEEALSEIASVTRLGGSTRYETAAEIAEWSVEQGMSYDGLTVATGTNYPDALTASALCGKNGSVLLLSAASASGSTALEEVISENAENISDIYIVGGYSSVNDEVRAMILDALQ